VDADDRHTSWSSRASAILWAAIDDADAVARLMTLATELPPTSEQAGEVATAQG